MAILVYILVGFSSFFFILVPVTGGIVLNPLLSLIVDPRTAISLSVFFFMLNSGIKATIFRKDIVMRYVLGMLPISIISTIVGTYLIGIISDLYLYVAMLCMIIFFASKKLLPTLNKKDGVKKKRDYGLLMTGIMSGFMQGTGLGGGGSLRKVHFLSEGLSLHQMHGTTSALSVILGSVSTFIRLRSDQVTTETLLPIIYLVPIMIISTILGRKALVRFSERTSSIIISITLVATVFFLSVKIIQEVV